jgi:hypothetical protein
VAIIINQGISPCFVGFSESGYIRDTSGIPLPFAAVLLTVVFPVHSAPALGRVNVSSRGIRADDFMLHINPSLPPLNL